MKEEQRDVLVESRGHHPNLQKLALTGKFKRHRKIQKEDKRAAINDSADCQEFDDQENQPNIQNVQKYKKGTTAVSL